MTSFMRPIIPVYGAFGISEDVSKLMPILLVTRNKNRCSWHCVKISCLSVRQDWAPEARRTLVVIHTAKVEVGLYHMWFCYRFAHSCHQMDVAWVIVDILTKLTYFITIHMTYPVSTLARSYKDHIVRLYEIPQEIISDMGPKFTSFI